MTLTAALPAPVALAALPTLTLDTEGRTGRLNPLGAVVRSSRVR
ncbi:hypothetical protein [Deinococcus sp. Marseille-Q6407]|nr:hypothetical protein [Deinococcus sp. Marseille-Q6407]